MRLIKILRSDCCPLRYKNNNPKDEIEKLKQILNNSGFSKNQNLFTDGNYVWAEGLNNKNKVMAIILADKNFYLKVSIAGKNKIISKLTKTPVDLNIVDIISSIRTINSFRYYMPNNVLSFIGENISIIDK